MVAFAIAVALACAVAALFFLLVPLYVMLPYKAQGPRELPLALTVQRVAPAVTAIFAVLALVAALSVWQSIHVHRTGIVVCVSITIVAAFLTRVDFNEVAFRPYPAPVFGPADLAGLDPGDMVLSVSIGGETHAYSVGAVGYHHVLDDVVGGVPVAPTYCTLCNTGIVWNRKLDDRVLTFHLAGIRNGNALLRDGETNSVWQQSTGTAIFGPLEGKQLELVHSDELTFGLWHAEHPQGLILKPSARHARWYLNHGWEGFVKHFPVVVDTAKSGIAPRELMIGIAIGTASKAFPWKSVISAGLIQDSVGPETVLLVVGPDGVSVRAFRARANATFFRNGSLVMDAETSSTWNFSGRAISGPLAGQSLEPIDALKHFWFDWQNYHPSTEIFRS